MTELEIIGDLSGKVMIDRPDRAIIIAVEGLNPIKFSIDHPHIKGTKLECDARAALSRIPQESARD